MRQGCDDCRPLCRALVLMYIHAMRRGRLGDVRRFLQMMGRDY